MIWGVKNVKKIAFSIFNTFDENALITPKGPFLWAHAL